MTTWQLLATHYQHIRHKSLRDLFASDPQRFDHFSIQAAGILMDYSKHLIDNETMRLLLTLPHEKQLKQKMTAMQKGDIINSTEKRAVLHMALRSHETTPDIAHEFAKMEKFVHAVYNKTLTGATGKAFTDVVNIGIGGSDLGPRMVVRALKPYHTKQVNCHFVSNVDATDLLETLSNLNPETTLFIVASKTFTTQETLMNAKAARAWLNFGERAKQHFVAITSNIPKAIEFGVAENYIFAMWDFIGGRYSLWSTIGLSIALAVGMDNFNLLREGARQMDEHFFEAEFSENQPVILALLGIWYIHFFQTQSHAVLPYDQHLELFPSFLQQLEMESNGKRVNLTGEAVDYQTADVTWGGVETNGQHAFHQLLHQGTLMIPVDFILARHAHHDLTDQHLALAANCFAQSEALMRGKTLDEAHAECLQSGLSENEARLLATHKVIPGNKPSTTLLIDQLTPQTLGALIALYEHKTFVQSVIWQINAFDQFGVELGKQLASPIFQALQTNHMLERDSSTKGLMQRFLQR